MSNESLSQFRAFHDREHRVAMATLVSATGSTSSIVGAKTFVGEAGEIVGAVTIGGCLDARAAEASDRVLRTGSAELVDIALADEDAWDLGLGCGGTVRLLVEAVDFAAGAHPAVAAYAAAERAVAEGRRVLVIGALLDAGPRLLVDADGTCSGSLGDAAVDARVAALALDGARTGPRVVRDDASGREYFVECFAPPVTAVVYGGGEVAVVLTRLARELGIRTVVVDARARYATRARFPLADEIRVGDPGAVAAELPATAQTFVVIVSHDYKFELPVLRHALRSPVGYVGLMSSRTRGAKLREVLAGEGFTAEELARLHTPIGLRIGARTPAEVAVSIAAELVAVRAGQGPRA